MINRCRKFYDWMVVIIMRWQSRYLCLLIMDCRLVAYHIQAFTMIGTILHNGAEFAKCLQLTTNNATFGVLLTNLHEWKHCQISIKEFNPLKRNSYKKKKKEKQ